jgi:hypothetical protein
MISIKIHSIHKKILFITFLLCLANIQTKLLLANPGTVPNETKPPLYVGAKIHYGFIIPHSEELKAISESNIWGFQVDFSKLNISSRAWSNCNCYSRLGLSFNFYDYRNPDVLGHSYNLAFFFEPYFNFKNRSRFSLRVGMGLTYLDKVYDAVSNPENLFFSSKFNGILLINLSYNYLIKERYQLNASINYTHISNAGAKMPNKGMNFPTASIGLDYILRPAKLVSQEKTLGLRDKKLLGYARIFSSIRSVDADSLHSKKDKLMIGLEGGIIKGLSNINGLLGGIEFSYDGSFQEMSDRMEENYAPFVLSLHFGHAFVIGRITFTQQMAYYVYKPFPSTSKSFFQRYGIYYRIGKMVSIGFSLKAHGHVAEHMDVRLGVEF